MGLVTMRAGYGHLIGSDYRFYSYGGSHQLVQ